MGILAPNARVYVNKVMLRNLSAIIGQIIEKIANNIVAQQTSLNLLAQLILDPLLAKQGGVCATALTACCAFINTSGEAETGLERISLEAKWLQDVRKVDPLDYLFKLGDWD